MVRVGSVLSHDHDDSKTHGVDCAGGAVVVVVAGEVVVVVAGGAAVAVGDDAPPSQLGRFTDCRSPLGSHPPESSSVQRDPSDVACAVHVARTV